jgi:hypothetical protein
MTRFISLQEWLLRAAYATWRSAVEAFLGGPAPSSANPRIGGLFATTGHFSSKRFYLITKRYQREVLQ